MKSNRGLKLPAPTGPDARRSWLRGTPQRKGVYSFTIFSKDELAQEARHAFELEVLPPPAPPLRIGAASLPDVLACTDYSTALACEGGYPPYTWGITEGSLPQGLTLEKGTILGKVLVALSKPQTSQVTVSVSDDQGDSDSATLEIRVLPTSRSSCILTCRPALQPLRPPSAIQGRPYKLALPVRGGAGVLKWSVAGELPPGTELSDGVLRGTPNKTGLWSFTVTVQDELGQELKQACRLTVLPLRPILWPSPRTAV